MGILQRITGLSILLVLVLLVCITQSVASTNSPIEINLNYVTSDGKPVFGPGDKLVRYSTMYKEKELSDDVAMNCFLLGLLKSIPGTGIIMRSDGSKDKAFVAIVKGNGVLLGYVNKGTLMVRDEVNGNLTLKFSPRKPDKYFVDGQNAKYDGRKATVAEVFVMTRYRLGKPLQKSGKGFLPFG
jgi:hypothetical protein